MATALFSRSFASGLVLRVAGYQTDGNGPRYLVHWEHGTWGEPIGWFDSPTDAVRHAVRIEAAAVHAMMTAFRCMGVPTL